MKLEIVKATVIDGSIELVGAVVDVDESTAAQLIREEVAKPAARIAQPVAKPNEE